LLAPYSASMDSDGRDDGPPANDGCGQTRCSLESPTARAVEWDHRQELELLEEAIERKRSELKVRIEKEHMAQKAKLEGRRQDLQHGLIAVEYDQRQRREELTQHLQNQELRFLREGAEHKNQRQGAMGLLSGVEGDIEDFQSLLPEAGFLEGQLQVGTMPPSTPSTCHENASLQMLLDGLRFRFEKVREANEREAVNLAEWREERETLRKDKLFEQDGDLKRVQWELAEVGPALQRALRESQDQRII